MKALIPLLCLVSACSATDPKVGDDLAALRREVAELRAVEQPKFDSAQAMEDLSKEVRRLRERLTQPAPPPPPPPTPVTLPTATIPAGGFVGGVGGTTVGVNDLYWVLGKVSVDGAERLVLAQYQSLKEGRGFKLTGVRMLDADLQIIEFGQDRPRVKEILEQLKKR